MDVKKPLDVKRAPEPGDIVWSNLYVPAVKKFRK